MKYSAIGVLSAALAAVAPYSILGVLWAVEWRYGNETYEVIAVNAAFIVTRLVVFLAALGLTWLRVSTKSPRAAAVSGVIAGLAFAAILPAWDRYLSKLYGTPWGDPSWMEVAVLFLVGVFVAWISRRILVFPWRLKSAK